MSEAETDLVNQLEQLGVRVSLTEPSPNYLSDPRAKTFKVPVKSGDFSLMNGELKQLLEQVETPDEFDWEAAVQTPQSPHFISQLNDSESQTGVPPHAARAIEIGLEICKDDIKREGGVIEVEVGLYPTSWNFSKRIS